MPGTPLAEAFVAVRASTSQVKSDVAAGFDSIDSEGHGRKVGSGFMTGLKAAVGTVAVAGLFEFGKDSLKNASDLNETVNKSSVIFGQNADAMQSWASGAAKNLGLTKAAALESAAGFGNMFAQLGFSGDQAASMSQQIVKLSADLGSFNNLPTAEVSDMIAAAFRGEYDSLQRLIPNINAARVEQEALGMTHKSSAKDLTASEKAAATLAIVQRDGAAATDDFAKTSGSAANQSKILAAQWGDLSSQIGSALLPILQQVTDKLLTVVGYIKDNINWIAPLVAILGGFAVAVWAVNAATSAWAAMQAVSKVATVAWTGAQWLLNAALNANPIGLVIIAIAALVAALVWAWNNSETFRNIVTAAWNGVKAAAETVVNWFVNTAWPFLQAVWNGIKDGVTGVWQWFSDKWNGIRAVAQSVSDWFSGTLVPAFQNAWNVLKSAFDTTVNVITGIWDRLKEAAAAPIRFVVNTVFGGVVDAFNKVSDFVHGPHIDKPTLGFARGGMLSGPGTGTSDSIPIWASAGEYVVNAKATAKHLPLLHALNATGYADGGIIGTIGSAISGAASAVWNFIRDPVGSIKNVINSLVGAVESTPLGQVAVGLVRKVIDSLASTISGLFSSSTAGAGEVSPGRVSVQGKLLDTDTYARIVQALGSGWQLFQGSWSTSVAASAGTHAGAGVADLAPTAGGWDWAVSMLRAAGLDAWFRNWVGNQHIHLVNPHVTGLSPEAFSQVLSFNRGGSGLAAGFARGGLVLPTFDRGGVLRPGVNAVYNGTGRDEALVPAAGLPRTVVVRIGEREFEGYVESLSTRVVTAQTRELSYGAV